MQTKEKPDTAGNPNEKAIKDTTFLSDIQCIRDFIFLIATAEAEAEAKIKNLKKRHLIFDLIYLTGMILLILSMIF